MKDDHNFYLKCDVLLLADVFEKIINNSLEKLLCLSHYLSVPAVSWEVMLNMTKVELELISDYFLKKSEEVKFLMFLRDIAKPTISI